MDEHDQIQSDISGSLESERKAAEIYTAAGYLVYVQFKKPKAETKEEIKENIDRGDLIVFKPNGSLGIVEVKRLDSTNRYAYFTEARDFINGLIVDRKETFDKKTNKPGVYLTFNHLMTYFFLVECKNKEEWTVRKEYCVTTKKMEDYYISKVIDCQFYKTSDKVNDKN